LKKDEFHTKVSTFTILISLNSVFHLDSIGHTYVKNKANNKNKRQNSVLFLLSILIFFWHDYEKCI